MTQTEHPELRQDSASKPEPVRAVHPHSSRAAAWLLGGLNFQIEHHLLP